MSATTDDAARAAVEQMQGAARQAIAAARIFLDVAEDLIDDPAPLVALLATMGEAAAGLAARGRAAMAGGSDDPDEDEPPVRRSPRVQHIRVL